MLPNKMTTPTNDADAVARVTESTIENPDSGIIGLRFLSLSQFYTAMRDAGWLIPSEYEPLMQTESATTYVLHATRGKEILKVILHAYAGGDTQVINAELVGKNKDKPEPVKAEAKLLYPWQKS